jgi:acetyl-CoA carboxylase biotin carboxyl carrier protein
MTVEEIRELIHMVTATGVAELEVQRGENRVWIKRTAGMVSQEILAPAAPSAPAFSAEAAMPAASPATQAPGEPDLTDPTLKPVKAPIVGTFYESSAPGADSFVRVGEHVKPGKVLCILESMKLMNEIEAEFAGTVVKRLVENGQPVEYGEVLFLVKPD